MIESPHVDAARGESHGLIFQRGPQFGRRFVPLGLIINLDLVAVGIVEGERRAVAEIAVGPTDIVARAFQRGDAALERLRAPRAKRHVGHARGFRGGQFQRVVLVIVPTAQINRIALARRFRHAHHVDEKFQAFVRLRRKHFHVREMREVENRFWLHLFFPLGDGFV